MADDFDDDVREFMNDVRSFMVEAKGFFETSSAKHDATLDQLKRLHMRIDALREDVNDTSTHVDELMENRRAAE